MKSLKFILHFVGILFFPIVIFVLSAIIWQNNKVLVEGFALVGSLWKIERIALYQLLLVFLLVGAALPLCFMFLLRSERRLFKALAKLRQLEREESSKIEKSSKPSKQTNVEQSDSVASEEIKKEQNDERSS